MIYFAYKLRRWRNGDYSGRVRRYRPHVPIVFPLLTTEPIHNPPSSESIQASSLKRNINSKSNSPKFETLDSKHNQKKEETLDQARSPLTIHHDLKLKNDRIKKEAWDKGIKVGEWNETKYLGLMWRKGRKTPKRKEKILAVLNLLVRVWCIDRWNFYRSGNSENLRDFLRRNRDDYERETRERKLRLGEREEWESRNGEILRQ